MSDQSPRYVVGVDVGGTFTDVFLLDQAAGRAEVTKVSSTMEDQSKGFIEGIHEIVTDFTEVATRSFSALA